MVSLKTQNFYKMTIEIEGRVVGMLISGPSLHHVSLTFILVLNYVVPNEVGDDILRLYIHNFWLSRLFLKVGWDNLSETFLKGRSLLVAVPYAGPVQRLFLPT